MRRHTGFLLRWERARERTQTNEWTSAKRFIHCPFKIAEIVRNMSARHLRTLSSTTPNCRADKVKNQTFSSDLLRIIILGLSAFFSVSLFFIWLLTKQKTQRKVLSKWSRNRTHAIRGRTPSVQKSTSLMSPARLTNWWSLSPSQAWRWYQGKTQSSNHS